MTAAAFSRSRLPPAAMFPSGAEDITARSVRLPDGVALRVAESGPPGGRPVVMLHGWAASLYTYRHLLRELAPLGFHGLAIDFRGHGLSDKVEDTACYTTETLVGDVLGVMDALGIRRASLIGHSMGGAVAARLALEAPDRVERLVLVNPAGFSTIRLLAPAAALSPRALDRLAPRLCPRWLVRHILRFTYGDPSRVTERDVDEYWAPSQHPGYVRAVRALLRGFRWQPLTPEELEAIRVPVLVLVGTSDRLVTGVRAAAERMPNATVVEVPGAGHLAPEERPDEVNRAILSFLCSPRIAGRDDGPEPDADDDE